MTKNYLRVRIQTLFTALVCFVAVNALAVGDDRFAVTVGSHDNLVIFGPKGEQVAELSVPSIAHPVSIGGVAFQVSYGRDANGQLTAILTPDSTTPTALHFAVLGKSVDADKAVVTLTFSSNLKSVTVDPGYVGSVEVNSHRLRQHHLADDVLAPRVIAPVNTVAVSTAVVEPIESVATAAPVASQVVSTVAPAASPETMASAFPLAPAPLASQLGSSLPAQNNNSAQLANSDVTKALPATATAVAATTAPKEQEPLKLYWSEPVTPPNGPAPVVGLDEIKMIEVHGPVSVTLANGEIKPGFEGMIVPSGSTVTTFDNASAALFMGGVNSARLMPHCELIVTQSLNGDVRKDTLDLRRGAVFSRVGRRSGEIEDYQVRTPEGVSDAGFTDSLAFRGSLNDLQNTPTTTTMNSGGRSLTWDWKRLLAWSPTSLGGGRISDVVDPMFAAAAATSLPSIDPSTFFFTPQGAGNGKGIKQQVIRGGGSRNGMGPSNTPSFSNPNQVLQAILVGLQPFNFKLKDLLNRVNKGTGTPGDVAFYQNLITVFFGQQVPSIISQFAGQKNALAKEIKAAAAALKDDLAPFGTNPLTPY